MNDRTLAQIARNIIAGFMLTLGIIPNEGEDDIETRDYGPHRVYIQMAQVPSELAGSMDPAETLEQLAAYLEHHNARPGSIRFEPYNVQAYVCPCGCGTYLYVSISHTA